jgi:mycofactocin precursor
VASSSAAESAVLAPEVVSEPDQDEAETPVLEELLVEEVSIDGMCGVY